MASFQVYQFLCVKCSEPLFSSLANSWLRVSRNHITFTPHTHIEALPSLDVHDDLLTGSKELEDCDICQLHCSNCLARVGVKCIEAVPAKQGFVGRFFVRQVALKVHGLTPQWSQHANSEAIDGWSATSGLDPVIQDPSQPLADLLLHRASQEEAKDQQAPTLAVDLPLQPQIDHAYREELKAIVVEHTRTIGQLVQMIDDLRGEIASVNKSLRRRKKAGSRKPSRDPEKQSDAQPRATTASNTLDVNELPAQMDIDQPASTDPSSMQPPARASTKARVITNAAAVQDTQQYLEQMVMSDDPADSDFELSDASQSKARQSATQSLVPMAQGDHDRVLPLSANESTDPNVEHSKSEASRTLPSNTEQPPKAASPRRGPGQFAIRGRLSRRGVSGRRVVSEGNRIAKQALPSHVRPGGHKELKVRTTSLNSQRGRTAGYRSSPLATSFSADEASDALAYSSASPLSPGPPQIPSLPLSSDTGPQATGTLTHEYIMRMVNKGMKSDYAKSHLVKDYARRSSGGIPGKSSSSRLAMAS